MRVRNAFAFSANFPRSDGVNAAAPNPDGSGTAASGSGTKGETGWATGRTSGGEGQAKLRVYANRVGRLEGREPEKGGRKKKNGRQPGSQAGERNRGRKGRETGEGASMDIAHSLGEEGKGRDGTMEQKSAREC